MKLWVVFREDLIDDYYVELIFLGIYSSATKADEAVQKMKGEGLYFQTYEVDLDGAPSPVWSSDI